MNKNTYASPMSMQCCFTCFYSKWMRSEERSRLICTYGLTTVQVAAGEADTRRTTFYDLCDDYSYWNWEK